MQNLADRIQIEESELIQFLKEHGYTDIQEIKKGKTRPSLRLTYKSSGGIEHFRTVKPLYSNIETDSVCTLINLSKKDVNLNEVLTANQINNLGIPGLVKLHDSLVFKGRLINVEEYFESNDLEDIIEGHKRFHGKSVIDNKRFNFIFGQLVDTVYSLNEAGILHRDIKPANVLVNVKDAVKLVDLQNCGNISNVNSSNIPMRGGTKYTHPDLLNALFSFSSKANKRTEAYALAATAYYTLIGEDLFDYEIILDENGKEIELENGEKIKVQLKVDGENADIINKKDHEKRLKRGLKKIPKRYRSLLYKSLTLDDKFRQYDTFSFKNDFEKIAGGLGKRLKDNLVVSVKPVLTGALVTGVMGSLLVWAYLGALNKEPMPNLVDILGVDIYKNMNPSELDFFNLDPNNKFGANGIINPPRRPYTTKQNYILKSLYNPMNNIKKDWEDLVENDENMVLHINEMVDKAYDSHGISKRIIKSWLMACYLSDKEKTLRNYNNERLWPSYVPRKFFERMNTEYRYNVIHSEDNIISAGVLYLKTCFGPEFCKGVGLTVADAYAEYFSDDIEDINLAKIRSESGTYLPNTVPSGLGESVTQGYGSWLPDQDIVDKAVSIYLLTDEEGNTYFDNIPRILFTSPHLYVP